MVKWLRLENLQVKVGWRSLMGGNGDTSVTGVVCCVLSCRAPISVYTICWHVYAHPSSCVTWFWREREGSFSFELWEQIVSDKFVTTGDQFWCSPSDQGAEVRQIFPICNTCMSWRCSISLATDWVRINGLLAGFRSVSSLTWRKSFQKWNN